MNPPNGNKYVGGFKDNKHNGQGTFTSAAGDKYVGEYKDDNYNGQGTFIFASGEKYVGEFKDGNYNGQGTFTTSSGDKYVGRWNNSKQNGQGVYTFATGETYFGEFKNSFFDGQGTYTHANGDRDIGEWKGHDLNGRGIRYLSNGTVLESGIFKDGTLIISQYVDPNSFTRIATSSTALAVSEAQRLSLVPIPTEPGESILPVCQGNEMRRWSNCLGSWTFANGNKYVGEFKDGELNGQGIFTTTSGKYVGEWKDNETHGLGIYFSSDGSVLQSGMFQKNNLIASHYVDPNRFKRIAGNNTDAAVEAAQSRVIEEQLAQLRLQLAEEESRLEKINSEPKIKTSHILLKSLDEAKKILLDIRKYPDSQKPEIFKQYAKKYSLDTGSGKNGGELGWAKKGVFVKEYEDAAWLLELGEISQPTKSAFGWHLIFLESKNFWDNDDLVPDAKLNPERNELDKERQRLAEEKRKFEAEKTRRNQEARQVAEEKRRFDAEKAQREEEKKSSRIAIRTFTTLPDANGDFTITISTGADTASLKIDGQELGGKRDGNYVIKRVARVGEDNAYKITARDVFGNTDSATVTVARQVADSRPAIPRLNPANVRVQQSRDAVAIIIGIENYRRVAKADFANADAKDFYTYASRALGIKPENVKLLVDDGADDIEMLNAFQNWLPLKVNKGKTDVYVFYSGHGYPSQDGKSLYFLPFNVDKQYLDRTSVKQKEIVTALQKAQAKSVTMFIDACYSGQTRNGEELVAGIKPVSITTEEQAYPPEFTVITASAADQFSSASQDLKHGIFSFYLMKALEGDADENNDGRLTSGELQRYLSDMVGRQAMGLNRTQNTQLFGNADRVLMTR